MRAIPLTLGRGLRGLAHLGKRVLGALVIGVAAIFLPKSPPDQHWSEPPVIDVAADYDQTVRSGDGPLDGFIDDIGDDIGDEPPGMSESY